MDDNPETLPEFLEKYGDQLVDRTHRMDPEFEDLIYGEELRDGMVVLATEPYRHRITDLVGNELGRASLLVRNRWCTVSRLRFDDQIPQYYFIGVYEDGTKVVRQTQPSTGWLVRRDTMDPAEPDDAPFGRIKLVDMSDELEG